MRRHFILTSGRSGSNFLVNTLNRHPEIANYGEVLGEWTIPYRLYKCLAWTGMAWGGYLNLLYKSRPLYYGAQAVSALSHIRKGRRVDFKHRKILKNIGIKDFAFLLKKRGLFNYLAVSEDIQVIHLHRKNILKRYLSVLRMKETGVVLTVNTVQKGQVRVNGAGLLNALDRYHEEKILEMDILTGIPGDRRLTIYYEDYFKSDESISKINSSVFQFLGVSPMRVTSNQNKIGSDNLKEYIYNYDEVRSILSGSKYEKYLLD